ncbi:MAG TPA: hypothetical protein VKY73_00665 [Polyangiaceae bacterium]|nr:hypothetical protein [Polyangiaceae bacterium]
MIEASALSLLFVAVAVLYGTARVRGRARLALLDAPGRTRAARTLAFVAIGVAGGSWQGLESLTAAVLVVLVGLMVLGTTVTLLGPVAPRLLWGAALLAAAALPVLAAIGGLS